MSGDQHWCFFGSPKGPKESEDELEKAPSNKLFWIPRKQNRIFIKN